MTMNIGGGFSSPMMNGMNSMGAMGTMGMSGMGSGNQFQYFKSKYGCEDCFRNQPYDYSFPKPRLHQPQISHKPNFLQRFLNNLMA